MDDPALRRAVMRWFEIHASDPWKARVQGGEFTDVRIEFNRGMHYSSYTFEDAEVVVIFERADGTGERFDLDAFWPDEKAKLGEFVEQVVALL